MKRLIKTANRNYLIDSIITKSGIIIGLSVRSVNNKPWYQIYQDPDGINISSLYDGNDINIALRKYKDVILAFKGINELDKFISKEADIKNRVEELF